MTAELGTFFLIIAFLAACLQAATLLTFGGIKTRLASCLAVAAWMEALFITLAFATLILLRLDDDFSVVNVILHSNLSMPALYKITGTWGNHEGSMLLFALVIAVFGATLAMTGVEEPLKRSAVSVQAALGGGIVLFTLFTSNPFARQFPPAVDGEALNPLLQDIALAIHPPLLYLGYVGFSIVFSLAVAALLERRMGREWADIAHPWILAAWGSLTLGIGLGSWWAYRELGWGGWWFWDPVENASLLPWLAGTALLHSNLVLKKRGLLAQWVLLLAILTFGLSLLGTFLVRSGALTSVHGFANDPARGLFILGYMVTFIGGALLLFAVRAGRLKSEGGMLPVSREGLIVVNNLFILSACATVLLGTTYPLLAEWISGTKLTVGPPYFNATFLPLMALPLLMAGLAPLMPWKKASAKDALRQTVPALLAALAMGLLVLAVAESQLLLAACGFALAAWLAASSLQWLLRGRGVANALPVFTAHLGAAVMVAGIAGAGLWKQETERTVNTGDVFLLAGFQLYFEQMPPQRGDNYEAQRGRFIVSSAGGRKLATLEPEYRTYDIKKSATHEAAIFSSWTSDLYAVIGETAKDGKHVAARIYYVPMIHFIWAGFMLMALGGFTALFQNRYDPAEV